MPDPRRSVAPLLALGMLVAGASRGRADGEWAFHHENVMGTALELRVRAVDEAAARGAEGRALAEIDRLSAIFSGYEPSSEFSRWAATPGPAAALAPELIEVLSAADRWRAATGGAFDPRVGAAIRLWKSCAGRGRIPTDAEIAGALALSSADAWRVDPAAGSAARLSSGPISLDGIAKGYIVQRAGDLAMGAPGVRGVLLNVGGDMRARGEIGSTVGVAPARGGTESSAPTARFAARDRSVATSGDAHRGLRVGGRWYSHIFDPRTGRPVDRTISATVVARDGAAADALATAFNVLPAAEALRLADSLPEVACLLVAADGEVSRSRGWLAFEGPGGPADDGQAPKVDGGWGVENELVVRFEINKPEGARGRYRRPYVAVWVEDKGGEPVRSLLLWVSLGGSGPDRWLPDLKRWYRADRRRDMDEKKNQAHAMAEATRQPGVYAVSWDGKDDDGKPLPPGEYFINVEAAREHGTHQNIRKSFTIADRPFAEELKGNVEIKAASIEYRRRAAAK